jgi:hypothetical protein
MQIRNLADNTQRSYVRQVSRFAGHFNKSPELLGPEQVRAYQVYLTNERKLAASYDPHRHCRTALPLQSDSQKGLGFETSSPLPRSRSGFRWFLAPKK